MCVAPLIIDELENAIANGNPSQAFSQVASTTGENEAMHKVYELVRATLASLGYEEFSDTSIARAIVEVAREEPGDAVHLYAATLRVLGAVDKLNQE